MLRKILKIRFVPIQHMPVPAGFRADFTIRFLYVLFFELVSGLKILKETCIQCPLIHAHGCCLIQSTRPGAQIYALGSFEFFRYIIMLLLRRIFG